jgi:WD40 repeat protein
LDSVVVDITPEDEPFVDLVQVRAEGAFGTGLLVGRGLVLTALHCVCDLKAACRIRPFGVYLFRDLRNRVERDLDAKVIWPKMEGLTKNSPDVAVLQIEGDDPPAPMVKYRFGELPRTPTIGCVRGFPACDKDSPLLPGGRIERNQPGRVTFTSRTRRALTIDATGPHDLEGVERWMGLSGGPLLVNELIVGVMREVPAGWKGEAIEAEPLPLLLRNDADPSLRTLLGVKLPLAPSSEPFQGAAAYSVIGKEAHEASNRTLETAAAKPFFGRSEDLAILDGAIAGKDRGVLLLRAEAGVGKSRLAALWAERCAGLPDVTVLRHAFSVREPAAGTRNAMVANLVRQAADMLGPVALGDGEPGDTARLADRLATLLGTDCAGAERLVIVLDALDEAAEPIEPWATKLGRGVFILVTCRAETNEEPRILRLWHQRATEEGMLALHYELPPLKPAAVAEWLTVAVGRQIEQADPLVARVMRAGEGVPLFVSYLIPDAIEALRANVVVPFPTSFGDYARQRLFDLKDRLAPSPAGRWSWGEVLDLFAVLCVIKVPLPARALRDLVGPQLLDEMDQRAERWLWRRVNGENATSFAHPRLAAVFGSVLPEFDPNIVVTAEERLVMACAKAWNSGGANPLRAYALSWLPAHLIGLDRRDEAADLLGNGAFLSARFKADPTTATVHKTASETIQLGSQLAAEHPAFEWRRFWAETEARVITAVERAEGLGLTEVLLQLAHDRFGVDAPAYRSLPAAASKRFPSGIRLERACGFRHPRLIRSFDNAHDGSVKGFLVLADGLISWGGSGVRFWSLQGEPRPSGGSKSGFGSSDGMLALADKIVSWSWSSGIRFWSLEGEPMPGGDPQVKFVNPGRKLVFPTKPKAHAGGPNGVLSLPDKLVSWGREGAICFWSLAGELTSGGNPNAHADGVEGVLSLANRLVSWGGDGAIRFWSFAGKPLAGGSSEAHAGRVRGLLALTDKLVSWGDDGAIRIWGLAGDPQPGGDPAAHPDGVQGVVALPDRLVSWNADDIRFWNLNGGAEPGGERRPHKEGYVAGMLALSTELISWGSDGTIRFWNLKGEPQPGSDLAAHAGGIDGVVALPNALVSWGDDGAIRFWSRTRTQSGANPTAHRGGIKGVLALPVGLMSWGEDGAIRLWSRAGEPQSGGDPKAHRRPVRSVQALGDRLVSWGEDGGIHFWGLTGEPLPGGDPMAHGDRRVGGVLALTESLVSWGEDGAIRFWTPMGEPRPGGDLKAHRGGVGGVLTLLDGLVSWGKDGAIRFWSFAGEPRPGDALKAHAGWIGGVMRLPDSLVSWGVDGAIRFWGLAGERRPGGDEAAHRVQGRMGNILYGNGVHSMLALSDTLVSCGGDGAIRFWSLAGEPRPGGDLEAHRGCVLGALSLPDGLVSWGRDGSIRFWSLTGEPRPGGDLKAHQTQSMRIFGYRGVRAVFAIGDELLSWGADDLIRRWGRDNTAKGPPWIAPAPLEMVTKVDNELWIGLLGRPHRLLRNELDVEPQ